MKKKLLTLCLITPLICVATGQLLQAEKSTPIYLAKCPCKNKPKNENPDKKDKEKNEKKTV
jgi:hypothetical protein